MDTAGAMMLAKMIGTHNKGFAASNILDI